MASSNTRPRIVILGAGFGGLQVARGLAGAAADVVVVDRTNHHLFQPLLYQVATAGLSPAEIAAPIRGILHRQRNTEVLMAEVTSIDVAGRRVLMGAKSEPYDYLVVATGARDFYFGHDEWAQYAPSLKSLAEATHIRQRILSAFEAAELEPSEERRRALMTFVVVGAGPTGVEMAGAIAELAQMALAGDFRHIDTRSARIILIEAGPRILAGFPEELATAAQRELERHGVEVQTDCKVERVDADAVTAGGDRIPTHTVIWAAGVRATPVGEWLKAETDKGGRVKVEVDLSVPGHREVFVIGDAARVEQDGKPLPGVAPVAMQQGRYVARVLRAELSGNSSRPPFHYHDKGNLATVGRRFAILDAGKIKLAGFVAWVAWLVIHIYYLIGFRNRVIVLIQWAWAYLTYQRGVRLITGATSPDYMAEQAVPADGSKRPATAGGKR